MNQAGAAVCWITNRAGRGLSFSLGCSVHSAVTLSEKRLNTVICYHVSSGERKSFSDTKCSCSFRISICMLNIDIIRVVPVSFPLIWLENKGPQARQADRIERGTNSGLFLDCQNDLGSQ